MSYRHEAEAVVLKERNPPACRDIDFERRLASAYPIYPELFDRLYSNWSGGFT